jgi:uncharacterized protein DUF4262
VFPSHPGAREARRKRALRHIRDNIARSGHHIYVVAAETTPRFAYTIGVSEVIGVELILAGACFYSSRGVGQIINGLVPRLKPGGEREVSRFELAGLGSFTLRNAHASWADELMLGALDYYSVSEIPALQIVPDKACWTIDVPDMSAPWSATTEPIWRWLHEPWTYPVPKEARAATDLAALRGERIIEAVRWEEDEWELFSGPGPDIPKDEMRMVPLGTLLAVDPSLVPVVSLALGEGLRRDPDPHSRWRPWRKSEPSDDGADGEGRG